MSSSDSQGTDSLRFLFPPWLTRRWGLLGIVAILYTLINVAWTQFHWGGSENVTLIGDLFAFAPSLLAMTAAWRVSAAREVSLPARRAWFLLGISFLMFLIGNGIWAYLELVLVVEPFPSIADVFYLAFYPIALWGLLSMPSEPLTLRERLTLRLDLLCILTAAAMFVGYFIIVPTAAVNNNDLLTLAIASAYPIGSLSLLGGILAILYRPASPNTRSALSLLLIGMTFFLLGDFAFSYTSLNGTYSIGGWTDTCWNVAQLFFTLAALRKMHQAPEAAPQEWLAQLDRPGRWLPTIAAALGYGLVFFVIITDASRAATWMMTGTLLLTLLAITRLIVSHRFAEFPIRTKLILTFILVSGLSVGLVSLASYLTIYSNLQSAVGIHLKARAQDRAATIGSLLSKQSDALEGFVLSKVLRDNAAAASAAYATTDPDIIQEQLLQRAQAWNGAAKADPLVQAVLNNDAADELREFQSNFSGYISLWLTDQYGALIAATERPTNYDQSLSSFWEEAYQEGRGAIYMSQPVLDSRTGLGYLVIVMPVRSHLHSELAGMLIATYSLKDLMQMLASEGPQQMDDDTLVLPNGQMLTSTGQFVSIDQNTLQRLQATAEDDFVLMNFHGKPQLVSQALIPSFDFDPEEAIAFHGLNWILVTHQDPGGAFVPLNAAWRTTLLTTLLVLLVTTGLALILAQVLVAPIARLTTAARQIEAGDLSNKALVESRDEIGTLAGTFNSMLEGLARAQEEVRESEALYRSLVEYSPDMITVHREGKVLFLNPAGVKLLGAPGAEEFVGKPLMEMISSQDQEMLQEDLENMKLIGGASPLLQRKMHRHDGTTFDAEFRMIPISHASRPAIQFIMRDITERKEAEEKIRQLLIEVSRQRGDLERRVAQRTEELNGLNLRLQDELEERQRLVHSLQESEQRFHLLFTASPDAILLIDPNDSHASWPIVDCNEVACLMNGYSREELIGQSIDLLNAAQGDPAERNTYLEDVRQNGILHYEALHRHKDGHLFPVEVSTSLITAGDRVLVLGIDRDITERKRAEEALRQTKELAEAASRAKSEFLSRMSHELRTPMNAILGFAQLLTMSQKDPLTATQKERVKQIVKGGEHLLDLINEILDMSRIEAGRVQISPEPVSIRESVQQALDLTAPLANNRNIQFQLNLATDTDPYVMVDRQRLKQILLNLLSNAVKYNRPGGFVAIVCEAAQSSSAAWRISVTDTGQGISPENLPHLFIPFERLSADQTTVEGTGLGLALAKRLVELMQGQIGVESVLGQGSTFWIELPAAESQLDRLQRTGGTGNLPVLSGTTRTILYVEDNIANFELVQQVLADYGQIELLWATDLETSLALARQHHPNLILLDLHLGGRDGVDVLQQLKQDEQTSDIPVVVVSADATVGQAQRTISMGAHSYLTKPLDVKRFVALIEQILSEEGRQP